MWMRPVTAMSFPGRDHQVVHHSKRLDAVGVGDDLRLDDLAGHAERRPEHGHDVEGRRRGRRGRGARHGGDPDDADDDGERDPPHGNPLPSAPERCQRSAPRAGWLVQPLPSLDPRADTTSYKDRLLSSGEEHVQSPWNIVSGRRQEVLRARASAPARTNVNGGLTHRISRSIVSGRTTSGGLAPSRSGLGSARLPHRRRGPNPTASSSAPRPRNGQHGVRSGRRIHRGLAPGTRQSLVPDQRRVPNPTASWSAPRPGTVSTGFEPADAEFIGGSRPGTRQSLVPRSAAGPQPHRVVVCSTPPERSARDSSPQTPNSLGARAPALGRASFPDQRRVPNPTALSSAPRPRNGQHGVRARRRR